MQSVFYANGQYYNPLQLYSGGGAVNPGSQYVPGYGWAMPLTPPAASNSNNNSNTGNGNNPFASASSGGVSGTLQPYVNRMTQNANQALYGGLLGYQPSQLVAGNAGGTPVSPNTPQWRLPSAIPTPNQGQVGLLGAQANPQQQMGVFGNRSWMVA